MHFIILDQFNYKKDKCILDKKMCIGRANKKQTKELNC